MLNKSIAYRLSIYISLSVISVFIAFIGIYFLFNQKIIEENVQNKAVSLSAEVRNNVERHVVATAEITSNISEQILFYAQQNNANIFLTGLIEKYSFINAIHVNIDSTVTNLANRNYYCFKHNDSTYLYKGNERFKTCVSENTEFKNLVENKVISWSEPIVCKRTNKVVVSYYAPIRILDDRKQKIQVGEVICELSLLQLNETLNQIKIGLHGFAFLLSKEGEYITHPIKEWILNRNIFDVPQEIFDFDKFDAKTAFVEKKSGTLIAHPEILNYEKCWVYYTPITENGWTLIFVLPHKELYEPLYLPVLQMLFFSVLGILIIYLLVTYIINKQIQPLSSVTQQLKTFSRITGDVEDSSQNEIVQVSDSLNSMQTWYENYKVTRSQEAQKSESRKRDIYEASEIQQSFIKTDFPAFPDRDDIDLFASYKPAKGVSGDLFDYFFIDDKHLVFSMGDVSGKGIPAAFFMSVAQTIVKNNSGAKNARLIVGGVNNELYTNNQHQFFLTLFLGVLNVETGKLNYCNAAHTAPYILKENGELINLAQSHGLPLGLYSDKKYKEANVQLENGDSVIVYTDGVTELLDQSKLQYGKLRFERNLVSLAGLSPKESVLRIDRSLSQFVGDSTQSDDISILILKYKP